MQYYVDELFDDAGNSRGWFVFYPNGDIFSGHPNDTQAHSAAGSLNRGEPRSASDSGKIHTTVELFDSDGNSIGSAGFDDQGNFIPGTHRAITPLPAKSSEPSKPPF